MESNIENMICPKCNSIANGNYCSHCGAKLKTEPFSDLTSYSEIIADNRCQTIIERAANKAKTNLTAPEFLQFAQMVMPGRLPLSALASISNRAGKKLDVGKEEFGFRVYHCPFSYVVLAHLTSLAKHSMAVKKVLETKGYCYIEAQIPSTVWNLEGRLETLIMAEPTKTKVMIEAKIFGQWLDLGKTGQMIERFLADMEKLSTQFLRNKELKNERGVATTV